MRLKKYIFIVCVLSIVVFSAAISYRPPQGKITNGLITASLFFPDAENGYYRGTRFDWSGQISALNYKNHSFFGKWFDSYSPTTHDAIMGPVEAFDPIGFDEATPGGRFLKVGVGILEKPDEQPYHFSNNYKLVNPGIWKTSQDESEVKFEHVIEDSSFAYEYRKTVSLTAGKPELVLSHTLKNTGNKTLETSAMNHNFFVIDEQPTGADFEILFPYPIKAGENNKPNSASISGNKIVLEAGDPTGKTFYISDVKGYSKKSKDHRFTLVNKKTRAAVHVQADQPIAKFNFWASRRTVCPEPYIYMKIEPGETFDWTITYRFEVNE